jgi:hypothetical protein
MGLGSDKMIDFQFQNVLNQYSMLGLAFLILVLGSLTARFAVKGYY